MAETPSSGRDGRYLGLLHELAALPEWAAERAKVLDERHAQSLKDAESMAHVGESAARHGRVRVARQLSRARTALSLIGAEHLIPSLDDDDAPSVQSIRVATGDDPGAGRAEAPEVAVHVTPEQVREALQELEAAGVSLGVEIRRELERRGELGHRSRKASGARGRPGRRRSRPRESQAPPADPRTRSRRRRVDGAIVAAVAIVLCAVAAVAVMVAMRGA